MQSVVRAFEMLFSLEMLFVAVLASVFGLFVGAIPGLSATMALALLVPTTFVMDPIPALSAMVACSAMAIFAGDIPGCLLRMPGTAASAAYTEEAYAMSRNGHADTALGAGLVFSAYGGLFGTAVLILSAPILAEFALNFTSFESSWLILLGVICAIVIASNRPVRGGIMLVLGLLVASVGMGNPAAFPRFAGGSNDLLAGIDFLPLLIGMFCVSEILHAALSTTTMPAIIDQPITNIIKGMGELTLRYPKQIIRGSALGTVVVTMPGAGSDIAAGMSYAISKKRSQEQEKFGTGHVEGIVESGAANNRARAGAWIPAPVFGIPEFNLTAIAIGVVYKKNLNPGPTQFTRNPEHIYAIDILFIVANLLMIPLGWATIKIAKRLLNVPREILMPIILIACIVGAFAMNNTGFDIAIMLVAGLLAWVLEENHFPVTPAILGVVLGPMPEEKFIKSMIKSDGEVLEFSSRPVAGMLGVLTVIVWRWPLIKAGIRRLSQPAAAVAGDHPKK